MQNAPSLFDQLESMRTRPLARRSDPETSHLAARRAAKCDWAPRVLEVLTFRALTDKSICKALGVDPEKWGSVKTARSRLKKEGKVGWTGDILDHQRVWTAVQNIRPKLVVVESDIL